MRGGAGLQTVSLAQHEEPAMSTHKGLWGVPQGWTTCKGPIGRSVLPLLGLLARLLPLPCSLWMMLSMSAISRERRKPANQDRNKSAPAERSHALRALPVSSRL